MIFFYLFIATPVEEACVNFFETNSTPSSNFHLKVSQTVLEAIEQCWKSDIFLQPLTQKFWKLSLQIIARYCKAVEVSCSVENIIGLLQSTTTADSKSLKMSETSLGLSQQNKLSPSPSTASLTSMKSHARSSSDTGIGMYFMLLMYRKLCNRRLFRKKDCLEWTEKIVKIRIFM